MDIRDKKYVITLVAVMAIVIFSAAHISRHLHYLDLPYIGVDILRQYQIDKLQRSDDIELIVVGDSAAGNAIDAEYLSELTGMKTVNLSLTGNFGFTGSYNMIRLALESQPNLKSVVVMNTLDVWYRKFSEEGYFSTLYDLEPVNFGKIIKGGENLGLSKYQYNPKEIYWFLKHRLFGDNNFLEIENDYMKQEESRYSLGTKTFDASSKLNILVNKEKVKMIGFIGELCEENSLRCIFVHGPIHKELALNSEETILLINESIRESKGVKVITEIFTYPESKLGDDEDHINPQSKRESTKDYFEVIKLLL